MSQGSIKGPSINYGPTILKEGVFGEKVQINKNGMEYTGTFIDRDTTLGTITVRLDKDNSDEVIDTTDNTIIVTPISSGGRRRSKKSRKSKKSKRSHKRRKSVRK